jgi:anti-sigma regulatory factor (Ser/Thr protein kinase)
MPRDLLNRPGAGVTMGSGLWSADQLLRPPAHLPADEQSDAAAPADPEPAADQRLIPALSSWARAFPGVPRQVKAARQFVAALLDGSPLRDDAVIVISELFTNALQHTRSGQPGGLVVVQVSRWRQGVRIAVTDQGSAKRPALIDKALADDVLADEALADRLLAGGIFPDDLLADGANHFPADCGRGLHMVSCLAEHLDWHDDVRGRTVHAVLGRR